MAGSELERGEDRPAAARAVPSDGGARDPWAVDGNAIAPTIVRGRRWLLFATLLAVFWLLEWQIGLRDPKTGEPLALRWLRAALDHPVRTQLALAIAIFGRPASVRPVSRE
jgi:hypothetical protein